MDDSWRRLTLIMKLCFLKIDLSASLTTVAYLILKLMKYILNLSKHADIMKLLKYNIIYSTCEEDTKCLASAARLEFLTLILLFKTHRITM